MKTVDGRILGVCILSRARGRRLQGSFGKVKEGFCAETLQRVALKILSRKRVQKVPDGITNALREIRLLRKLRHKNVIQLKDVWCKTENLSTGSQEVVPWRSDIVKKVEADLGIGTSKPPGREPSSSLDFIKSRYSVPAHLDRQSRRSSVDAAAAGQQIPEMSSAVDMSATPDSRDANAEDSSQQVGQSAPDAPRGSVRFGSSPSLSQRELGSPDDGNRSNKASLLAPNRESAQNEAVAYRRKSADSGASAREAVGGGDRSRRGSLDAQRKRERRSLDLSRRRSITEESKKGEVKLLKWYLAFELCPGTLQNLVDNSPNGYLPPHQAQKYFRDLMEGMQYLHNIGIIHRDIKPGNLLLGRDGSLKITDFGVAEVLDSYSPSDACQTFSGTHQFLSPEVIESVPGMSGSKVDIWACGVTLFNMVTGSYPFELLDGNILGLYEAIAEAKFDIPANVHNDLAGLIRGILCKDAAQRLSADEILRSGWMQKHFPATADEVPSECAIPRGGPENAYANGRLSLRMKVAAHSKSGETAGESGLGETAREASGTQSAYSSRSTKLTGSTELEEGANRTACGASTSLTPFLNTVFLEEIKNDIGLKGLDVLRFDEPFDLEDERKKLAKRLKKSRKAGHKMKTVIRQMVYSKTALDVWQQAAQNKGKLAVS